MGTQTKQGYFGGLHQQQQQSGYSGSGGLGGLFGDGNLSGWATQVQQADDVSSPIDGGKLKVVEPEPKLLLAPPKP